MRATFLHISCWFLDNTDIFPSDKKKTSSSMTWFFFATLGAMHRFGLTADVLLPQRSLTQFRSLLHDKRIQSKTKQESGRRDNSIVLVKGSSRIHLKRFRLEKPSRGRCSGSSSNEREHQPSKCLDLQRKGDDKMCLFFFISDKLL